MNVLANHPHIPLHCNICPKKPDFSDVSHLLTHVASKGHLSNYYKMKVRASTDDDAKNLVDDYDEWYEEHNLQDLMMERMSQKEKKRGSRTAANASRRGSAATSMSSSRSTPVSTLGNRRATRQQHGSMLDPQLGTRIKLEPKSRSGTPGDTLTFDFQALPRTYAAPMPSWPTTPYETASPMKRESLSSSLSDDASFDMEPPVLNFPASRGSRNDLTESNDSLLAEDDWEMNETTTDATKLKGVYWPGMALFDSATPEMQRRRNQKKAFSVVQQLMATSEAVEPNELIFDGEGTFRKIRDINGNADDDDGSVLSGEATPEPEPHAKKTQARRPRQPLANRNVNTGRVLRRSRRDSHHPPFGNSKRTPYFDGVEDEDENMTYGRRQPKPKRTGMSIHRDDSGPDITFTQPAPSFNVLSSGFRQAFRPQAQLPQPMFHQPQEVQYLRTHQRLPSSTFDDTFGASFGSTFRPSNNSHHAPGTNLASFGQLNHNMTYLHHNNFSHMNGAVALAAFQQQFIAPPPQTYSTNDHMFSAQTHNTQQDWDNMFGLGNPDSVMSGHGATGLHGGNDLTSVNPLFFSSNHPTPEDDQATISAHDESEH